jgi:hypothetical protein
MMRSRLRNRRSCETRQIEASGLKFVMSVDRYDDGRIGELFLTNHKAGSAAGIMASDSAVLASLLLQHGVSLELIRRSLMRDPKGKAMSPIGAALDSLAEIQLS